MQRIAVLVCAAALLLAGCQAPPKSTPGGVPGPVLGTRPPPTIKPIPPPAPQPAPVPEYGGGAVKRSDIIPPGGISPRRWKVIVVHHSAAENATPQGMDAWHHKRGWSNGLGYHFVIGNGVNYPDGQLYVGPRWRGQETGAHCKSSAGRYMGVWRDSNFFNEQGIGICLIGNFQSESPTPAQLRTLQDLICLLSQETGIAATQIYGHGEITHKTECPGRYMNMASLRRNVAAALSRPAPTAGAWSR